MVKRDDIMTIDEYITSERLKGDYWLCVAFSYGSHPEEQS